MLGAIYVGLSGMNAYSKGLQTISNNVANLNTSGFKSTAVSFTDVFNHGGGGLTFSQGTSFSQAGNGVRFGEPRVDFSQGDLRQSDGDLDLAIQGSGFLVLLNDGKTYYTRTGQFTVDKDGYISELETGYRLGILDESRQPVALNIDEKRTSAPVATTKVVFADTLSADASAAVSVANIAVYDSRGGLQTWTATFTKSGAASLSEWDVVVKNQTGTQVGTTQKLRFIGFNVDPATATLKIDSTPAGGGDAVPVTLDFSAVKSFVAGSNSTIRASSVDGNGVGTLTTVTIEDGKVKLTYSNEKTDFLGTVAIADFRDPQQLERIGDGRFENRGSGQFRLLESGAEGAGKLVSRQIEASNVDLSQEFGDLILIQRGFQASSQVVSTANDMIQQLFGIRGQG